jgi:hypothetical protein
VHPESPAPHRLDVRLATVPQRVQHSRPHA